MRRHLHIGLLLFMLLGWKCNDDELDMLQNSSWPFAKSLFQQCYACNLFPFATRMDGFGFVKHMFTWGKVRARWSFGAKVENILALALSAIGQSTLMLNPIDFHLILAWYGGFRGIGCWYFGLWSCLVFGTKSHFAYKLQFSTYID